MNSEMAYSIIIRATLAASSGVSERNLQRHGRWASVTAKNILVG